MKLHPQPVLYIAGNISIIIAFIELYKLIIQNVLPPNVFRVPMSRCSKLSIGMKNIYKAVTEEAGLIELDKFEDTWGKKYPAAVKSWRENWTELGAFFKYPPEIRKLIYTTNRIENFNRCLRKVTKAKAAYPSDTALLKSLYLAIRDITEKWGLIHGWKGIFGQLMIIFSDRIQPEDYR